MAVCQFCKDRDDTPPGATVISNGQRCGRCSMTYTQMRAELAKDENDSLTNYTDDTEGPK